MNFKKLTLCALVAFGSISLASCDEKPKDPEVEKATITVDGGTGSGTYIIGSTATIVANSIVGKTFKEWQVNDETRSTLNPYTFTVTKTETYVAIFDITKVKIDVVGGEGSGTYNYGDTVTVSPNVEYGYEFVSWLVNDNVVSNSPTYSFTAENDLTITANIKEQEKVVVNVVGGTGSGTYVLGNDVTVVANVAEDQEFVNWTVNGEIVSTSVSYTFAAEEDVTLIAHTKSKETGKVVVTVEGGSGSGTYDIGATVTVVATVAAGKKFVNWTIDDSSVSTEPTYVFIVTTDVVLVANFEDIPEHEMAKYTKTVKMSGDDFKILNLTDIQLHDGDDFEINKGIIEEVIEKTQPDLITVLGDIINDHITYSTVEMPEKIINFIDSFDIPWAPLFGNHDNIEYKPEGTQKYGGVAYLEELFAECENCLYVHGPEGIQGSSNYIVNLVDEETGNLFESLIFLDSFTHGLNSTNTAFYADAVDYVKLLNNDVTPRSIVFEHIPILEYLTVFNEASDVEFHNMSGCPNREPLAAGDGSLFPKIKELGSTKTVISGHDHENAFYADYQGVNLVYALKSSLGDDADGNSYTHPVGGLLVTLDGESEKFDYVKVTDLPYEVINGGDYPYSSEILQYWRYSGATLEFDIELPDTGSIKFNLEGTNFRRDVSEKLQKGSWNRLTKNITIDAENKTTDCGSLTPIDNNKYHYSVDLTEIGLNTDGAEKSYGDETVKIIYFHSATNNFKINDIHFSKEEVPVTDQIDLSNAQIADIPDQPYLKGKVVRPDVFVTIDGKQIDRNDILVKYSNEKEIGTAGVEIVPSGKGAHTYKGSVSTTFNIVGNPWRGNIFEAGYSCELTETPLTETITFDVHFTSSSDTTMYFMIGDGWNDYFGYYGLNANGTLVDKYDGVTVAATSDEYVRVTCVLNEMNKTNGSNPNPTEKVNLFFVHGSWGNNPKGYIDFDLNDAPETVRGEAFVSGTDKTINLDKISYGETVVVDFKFTSDAGTHVNFCIGNTADGWSRYFGYFKVTQGGTLGGSYDGVSLTTTADGYYRITLVLDELTKSDGSGGPKEEEGFNLFYIRGGWTTGSGYVDFNPTI